MWREFLAQILGQHEADQFEELWMPKPGVSGAHVILVRRTDTGQTFVVKFGETPRHPLLDQVKKRQLIAPLFGEHHLPRVLACNEELLLMEAADGQNLHEAVISGSYAIDYLKEMHLKVLARFGEVWIKNSKPYVDGFSFARDPIERAQRIAAAVQSRVFDGVPLVQVLDKPVIINGQKLNGTLRSLLDKLTQYYKPPKQVVLCHGDPNADNMIINSSKGWWLVDWEWVGYHDWRVLASHFVGWWVSNATLLKEQPTVHVDGRLEINYSLTQSELVTALQDQAWEFIERVGISFKEENWHAQVSLQLALFLLGDLRFIETRGRSNHAIPLLGEGLHYLDTLLA